MNQLFAKAVFFLFCVSVGIFQIARGLSSLRSRRDNRRWAVFRIVVATILMFSVLVFLLLG